MHRMSQCDLYCYFVKQLNRINKTMIARWTMDSIMHKKL